MAIAIVLGGARCVWDDLRAAEELLGDRLQVVVACNYAGIHFTGRLAAWATEHADLMAGWRTQRRGNADYRTFLGAEHWTCRDAEVVEERWPGSSGLYAVQIALTEMQASAAILCGMPLDRGAGHFDRPGPWSDTDHFRHGFCLALPVIGGRVRSMGGWTADLLGTPAAAWLDAVSSIRPLSGPTTRPTRRPMHHVKNVSEDSQPFHGFDEEGEPKTFRLAPGESGKFEINPAQAAFQSGELKVTAVRADAPPATPAPPRRPKPRTRKG